MTGPLLLHLRGTGRGFVTGRGAMRAVSASQLVAVMMIYTVRISNVVCQLLHLHGVWRPSW